MWRLSTTTWAACKSACLLGARAPRCLRSIVSLARGGCGHASLSLLLPGPLARFGSPSDSHLYPAPCAPRYHHTGQFGLAEENYAKCINIRQFVLGARHHLVGQAMSNLGAV